MAMGTRGDRSEQDGIWIAHAELAFAPGHPFYEQPNELLDAEGFDEFAERLCARFYHAILERPSLTPGFTSGRSPPIGYFEGIDGERGPRGGWRTRWHCSDLWESGWTRRLRISRRSRARGG